MTPESHVARTRAERSSRVIRLSHSREVLVPWYREHGRVLPWRGIRDPWSVLVSEVALQQTTVHQGLPYYERIIRRFPTAASMAGAMEEELLSLWEGLGYYSRARNLRTAAQVITEGGFPDTYEGIISLPGVGPYTAAAVGSIVFDLPTAVLDGNVHRVLSRYFGIPQLIERRSTFQGIAQSLLDPSCPGDHNQAMMDLGATVCTPRTPKCGECPLAPCCRALAKGEVHLYPPPRPQRARTFEDIHYLVCLIGNELGMVRRESSPWRGLYEFPRTEPRPGAPYTNRGIVGRRLITTHFHIVGGLPEGSSLVHPSVPMPKPVREFVDFYVRSVLGSYRLAIHG